MVHPRKDFRNMMQHSDFQNQINLLTYSLNFTSSFFCISNRKRRKVLRRRFGKDNEMKEKLMMEVFYYNELQRNQYLNKRMTRNISYMNFIGKPWIFYIKIISFKYPFMYSLFVFLLSLSYTQKEIKVNSGRYTYMK